MSLKTKQYLDWLHLQVVNVNCPNDFNIHNHKIEVSLHRQIKIIFICL